MHYVFAKDVDPGVGIVDVNLSDFVRKAFLIYHFYQPIPIFKGIHEGYILKGILVKFNAYAVLFYVFIFVYYLIGFGKYKNNHIFYLVIILAGLCILLPVSYSHGIAAPGERLLLFIAILVIAQLLYGKIFVSTLSSFFLIVAIVKFAYINYVAYEFNNNHPIESITYEHKRYHLGRIQANIDDEKSKLLRNNAFKRYTCMFSVFCYQLVKGYGNHDIIVGKIYYDAIEKNNKSLPFFNTGILRKVE